MQASCDKCRFWHRVPTGNQSLAECRRYPPTILPNVWPRPEGKDWCGEFQRAVTLNPREGWKADLTAGDDPISAGDTGYGHDT